MRPQIGQELSSIDGIGGTRRAGCDRRHAAIAGSTGISRTCRATPSTMRCISRPKPTSCAGRSPRELASPAPPITAAATGQPRISAIAVSAGASRAAERGEARQAHRAAHPQQPLGAAMVLGADQDQRAAPQAARDLEIPAAPAGIRRDDVFVRHEEVASARRAALLFGAGLAPIGEVQGALAPRRCGRAARSRAGRYGSARASRCSRHLSRSQPRSSGPR